MGVPSFYRWLVNKYPKAVVDAIAKEEDSISSPNPNGIEFDNLYLDMNGIIHPCFHPDDNHDHDGGLAAAPTTFENVLENIFEYIDQLFSIVRPRKLLYLAIDGVAPRAKMNQQRARRFRAAKDREIYEAEEMKLRKQFEMEGKQVLPKQDSEVSDSNIITPGTAFMYELSKALQIYIRTRLTTNMGWKGIKVILSDANVPGEGEHKIMSFIRNQRQLPTYDPNTCHCLYGLDADLIMLALATHELHFSILREDLRGHGQINCTFESLPKSKTSMVKCKQPYQFLHIWILREYLEVDMQVDDPPKDLKMDLERLIDDFIVMSFFVGNDFLPHMPTLEIHEGAIDLLMAVHKKEFKNFGGYLVDMERVQEKKANYIKLSRVEKFMLLVGTYEENIFKKRSDLRQRKLRNLCNDCNSLEEEENNVASSLTPATTAPVLNIQCCYSEILENTKQLKCKLNEILKKNSDLFYSGSFGSDRVKLDSPGFKQRYYKEKFSAQTPDEIECTRKKLVKKYTEGLLWVLLYYFSSPPSWTWFYPYYYGPFVSDLKGLSQVKQKFEKGSPFKPFDQLMAVLPPRSASALPKAYQPLVLEDRSSIIDFYPNEFEVDEDGKRFSWQGICKLPFIDEERLLKETKKLEKDLKGEEKIRNTEHFDRLFVGCTCRLASQILSLPEGSSEIKLDSSFSVEIGRIHSHHTIMDKDDDQKPEKNVLCVLYKLPDSAIHVPRLLEGVKIPDKKITENDLTDTKLWHEYRGTKPPNCNNWAVVCRASTKGNSAHNNRSSSLQNHKFAGSRWSSAGRGKPNSYCNGNSVDNDISTSYHNHKFAGSEWSSAGRGKQHNYGNGNLADKDLSWPFQNHLFAGDGWSSAGRGKLNSYGGKEVGLVPEWSAGRGRGKLKHCEGKELKDSRISGQSQYNTSFNIHGRVQPVNNSFWPSRYGVNQDVNDGAWRRSSEARVTPPGPAAWNPQPTSLYTWRHHSHSEASQPHQASRNHLSNSTFIQQHNSGSAANHSDPSSWDQRPGSTYAQQCSSGKTGNPSMGYSQRQSYY